MTEKRPARLIVDPPASGAWNMAVDKALLETAEQTGLITLRFYQWNVPTISLGYFQKHESRQEHPPSLNCELVRRQTGGGAIVHDRELTYSLCIPSRERWSSENRLLYDTMHQTLIDLLAEHGIQSHLFGDGPDEEGRDDKDRFLCFERRAKGDLIMDGYKVAGSAQRRGKKALLQHGSILLHRSEATPELPGINELSNQSVELKAIQTQLTILLADSLDLDLTSGKLNSVESDLAKQFSRDFFQSDDWNLNR